MGRSRIVALLAAALSLAGAAVAVAQEGAAPLRASAEVAADEAAETAREIAEQATEQARDEAEDEDEDELEAAETDEAGEPQGFGSEAFQRRHQLLADKFADIDHPVFDEHPAARVHQSLANGEHPRGLGREQAAAARRMADARHEVAGEDARPPDGRGRPDHAGPKGEDDS